MKGKLYDSWNEHIKYVGYYVNELAEKSTARLLIVSGDGDKYSKDASYIIEKASPAYSEFDALHNLQHKRYPGGHALTKERFDAIIEWVDANSKTSL